MGDECTIHHIIINPIDTIQSMYGHNSTCIMQTKLMAFPWAFPKVGCKYYLSSSHRHMLIVFLYSMPYTHTRRYGTYINNHWKYNIIIITFLEGIQQFKRLKI